MALAGQSGIASEERQLESADVLTADEVFITGTTREITPVSSIDETAIGSGAPGPITSQLMAAFQASARS